MSVLRTKRLSHDSRGRHHGTPSPWLPVTAVFLGIALMVVWWKPWRISEQFASSQRGIGTIAEVKAGFRGKYSRSFTYRVRMADGTEGEATLRDAFSPGTRLRFLYSKGTRNHLRVYAYEQCSSECSP